MTASVDPARHPAHEFPLAERLVDGLIRRYIETSVGTSLATNPYLDAEAEIYEKAIDSMRAALTGWDYRLTPKILDALRRAGLLNVTSPDSQESR